MTISAQFIDQIVQNVMREMQTRVPTVAAAAPAVAAAAPAVMKQTVAVKADTLQIAGRVISENVLIAANAAGRAISLQSGAVITPSGREFIRKNNVRMTSLIGGKSVASAAGTFIVVGPNTVVHTAASAAGWKTLAAATEFDAAVVAAQNTGTGMVTCCGGEPSIVACLLNRNPAVRAAVITRATNLVTLATVMNPQVVCLDSSGWSFGDILRLLRSLAAPSGTPDYWKEIPAGSTR
jgi:hypothetical protein